MDKIYELKTKRSTSNYNLQFETYKQVCEDMGYVCEVVSLPKRRTMNEESV